MNAGDVWLAERCISLPSANSRGGMGRYVVAGLEAGACGGGSWREPPPFILYVEMRDKRHSD